MEWNQESFVPPVSAGRIIDVTPSLLIIAPLFLGRLETLMSRHGVWAPPSHREVYRTSCQTLSWTTRAIFSPNPRALFWAHVCVGVRGKYSAARVKGYDHQGAQERGARGHRTVFSPEHVVHSGCEPLATMVGYQQCVPKGETPHTTWFTHGRGGYICHGSLNYVQGPVIHGRKLSFLKGLECVFVFSDSRRSLDTIASSAFTRLCAHSHSIHGSCSMLP